jgi:hypothetical protein
MLPWLALTYTAARLGFEAQNAAAFRLLRLGRGITCAPLRVLCHGRDLGSELELDDNYPISTDE